MEWEHFFKSHILDRGYEYYCDDAVENLNEGNGKVTAVVLGNDAYDVEITFDGDEIADMYCTCPYAQDGNACKHMAAVLYQRDAENELKEVKDKQGTDTAADIIDRAEDRDVRDFLLKVLERDEQLLLRFKAVVDKKVAGTDISLYKRQIDEIVRTHSGRDGFISYRQAYDFAMDLDDVLMQDVRQMIECGNLDEAFELSCYIFGIIGEVDMDDSDGGTAIVASTCQNIWHSILAHCDRNMKKQMFQWFAEHLNGSIVDYLEDEIDDFLTQEFCEPEFIEKRLELTNQMLKNAQQSQGLHNCYQIEYWVRKQIALMEKAGKTEEEIDRFCREYWQISSVREYYADKCIERKEYEEAISVLEESMEIDKAYRGLTAAYGKTLKGLYLETGQKEAYLEMLWQLELELSRGSLDIYKELAGQYTPQQWAVEREKIFEKLDGCQAAKLYLEDELYDRLLTYVQKSAGLSALNLYEADLEKRYPAEILEKYSKEVENMARPTTSRTQYKELVKILRKMKKYPGGPAMAENIAGQWRVLYKNRRAMMEELGKL